MMVFWANVAEDIQRDFASSSLMYIFQYYFLDSIVMAVLFALFTGFAAWRRPEVVKSSVNEYLYPKEENEGGVAQENPPAESKEAAVTAGGTSDRVAPEKPELKAVGDNLVVQWQIPNCLPPIAYSSISVRVVGTAAWKLVDTSSGIHVLVSQGGESIAVPTSTITVNVLQQMSSSKGSVAFEARVCMMDSEGWGPWSPSSDSVRFHTLGLSAGDKVQALPGKELVKGDRVCYSEGDIGTIKEIFTAVNSGDQRLNIKWDSTGLESSVPTSQWTEYFKLVDKAGSTDSDATADDFTPANERKAGETSVLRTPRAVPTQLKGPASYSDSVGNVVVPVDGGDKWKV